MGLSLLTSLGLVSGILSSWILRSVHFGNFSFWPGLLFGIAIALFFIWQKKSQSWLKILGFIIASIISYFAAFQLADFLSWSWYSEYSSWLCYLCGGLIGALLLSIGFSWLLHRFVWKQILVLTFVGGLLGVFGYLVSNYLCPDCYRWDFGGGGGTGFNWLYIIWQTGMALGFGLMLS